MAGVIAAVLVAGLILSAPAHETIGPAPPDLAVEAVNIASTSGSTLRRAELLHEAGFAVLLFDFQAHGESTGARITFGHLEALDAQAAVAFVRQRLPQERIAAIGSSLGGAAALLGPAPLSVDALVLESVYPEIGSAIANRVRVVLGSTLGDVVAPAIAWLFQLILPPYLGVHPADLRPIDHIAEVTGPVLVASGTRDNRTTIEEARALFERARTPKIFWEVAGARHVDLEAYAPAAYRDHVLTFLIERLREAR